jgi:hypothetical protein
MLTVILNGRTLENDRDQTLESLKKEWQGLAEDSGRLNDHEITQPHELQIVWRDKAFGSVMTAYVNDTRTSVNYQVIDMG